MFKAVIFDLDGVLVDASRWHFEALNRALKIFGYSIPLDVHEKFYEGLPTNSKLNLLSETQGFPKALHPLVWRLKQQFTNALIADFCTADPAKHEMLSFIQNQGLKLAVCSNAIRASVDIMLERSDIKGFFELTLSNEDVLEPKPSPLIYNLAMKILGVLPSECLIIEDSAHGQLAAKRSGAVLVPVSSYKEVDKELILGALKTKQSHSAERAQPCFR